MNRMNEYKGYKFHISDYDKDMSGIEYHRWHITHINGDKLKYPLSGTIEHATTYAAYHAAIAYINRQLAEAAIDTTPETDASIAANADAIEFARLAEAKRGTLRIERADYVTIAHLTTYREISTHGLSELSRWYVTLYCNAMHVVSANFDMTLTYDALDSWVTSSITAHMTRITPIGDRSNADV